MADYDPVPGETFIGDGHLDFLPAGGTEGADNIKLRLKNVSIDFESEVATRYAPYGGMLWKDRVVGTKGGHSFIGTIDEPRNAKVVQLLFRTATAGGAPGQKLWKGTATLKLVDAGDGGSIDISGFKCVVQPEGSMSADRETFSEAQLRITPLGGASADLGTVGVTDPA
ncbi:MAG: hypothetical protein ABQ298_03780 [Puniceicoccaceae bacterium]